MAKKDFGNIAGLVRSVAETQPGVRAPVALAVVPAAAPAAQEASAAPSRPASVSEDEGMEQQAINMRPALRRQLRGMAAEAGLSITGYVLAALRDKGLPVTDADIEDRRKRRR